MSAAIQKRVQYGFRGVRVGEASNPGPVVGARTTSKYGLRGTRVGEAANPGPPRLCRLRKGMSSIGPSLVAVWSDEEPLVRPNTGKDVLPRFSAGPIAFVGPIVPRPSEHDEPSTQPAFVILDVG